MSSDRPPEQDPTRRYGSGDDPTLPHDPGTDPTRPAQPDADPTEVSSHASPQHPPSLGGIPGAGAPSGFGPEGTGGADTTATTPVGDGEGDGEPPRRGRAVLWLVVGAILGVIITLIVVALGTSEAAAPEDAALAERVEELEAQLDERDLRIEELEARVAEAEAAVGDRDADLDAQRQALDERAAVLEEWAEELEDRQRALDQREQELVEREQQLPEDGPPATEDPDDGEAPAIDLPEVDTEDLETAVDRLLDWIRGLFGD